MESEQLLTQGEIFKDEIPAGTERTNNPAEQVPEPHNHGKNLSEMSPTEPIPKSLMLRVHDVLMSHSDIAIIKVPGQGSMLSVIASAGQGVQRVDILVPRAEIDNPVRHRRTIVSTADS